MADSAVTFRVFRYNPVTDDKPYWALYSGSVESGDPVLTGLMRIREEQDGSLAFRASCRSGIFGSDAMVSAGQSRLACKTPEWRFPRMRSTPKSSIWSK